MAEDLFCKQCGKKIAFGTFCSTDCVANSKKKLKDVSREFKSISTVKKLLLKERGERCQTCKRKKWRGRPIGLTVAYKDNDPTNWRLDNLLIMCYNCRWTKRSYNL